MNDIERLKTLTDPTNDRMPSSERELPDDDLLERIAARIVAGPSAAARTVASTVRLLKPVIARARRDGIGWDHIAASLRGHSIVATADAVRMAYNRSAKQQRSNRASVPVMPAPPASRPDPVHSAPRFSSDPTPSSLSASGGRRPSIAKRAK